jgi:hypothetical protein
MPTAPSTASIRAWALDEGLAVAARGRLKPEIIDAYAKAHDRPLAASAVVTRAKTSPIAEGAGNVTAAPDPGRLVVIEQALTSLATRVAKLEAAAAEPPARRWFGHKY